MTVLAPVNEPAPRDRPGHEALVSLLVIAAATALVYANTFHASFHFDDLGNIVSNDRLRDLGSFWPPSGRRWLGYLSFALNYRLGGLEVSGYHLANVLVHVCNGLLVFWLAAITLRTPALRGAEAGPLVRRHLPLAAGLLFAVHPVQTEAVTYIVQRFTSLATLFYLLSIALYATARLSLESDPAPKARAAFLYCSSIVAAAAAMETKEISFTLPLVAAGYELLFFKPGRRLLLLAPLAATALLVPLGFVTEGKAVVNVLGDPIGATEALIPRSAYLLTESRVVVTYLRLLLLPVGQNLDYDLGFSSSLADPDVLLALSVLLAVAASAVLLLIRARKANRAAGVLVFFGIAWFFVTLSVESTFIPIRDVIFEHRMYLPSAGAAIALGTALLWAVERLRSRSSLGLQCAAALVFTAGPLGAATYARNLVWKDELTLWTDVVAKSPRKARAHYALGFARWRTGHVDDAMGEYRETIRLDPTDANARTNLGLAYEAKGLLDDAVSEYRQAIQVNPAHATAHQNLGLAYAAGGHLKAAILEYREAIRLVPGLAASHDALGFAYWATGRADDATREFREAIRLDPGLANAHSHIGNAYEAKGELDEAIREYREAIRLDPGLAQAHLYLGNAYRATRRMDDAVREYREAVSLDPQWAEAHGVLGDILEKQGRPGEAVEEFRRAHELQPLPEIVLSLARSLEADGRREEAIAQYQRFLIEAGERYPDAAKMVRGRIAQLRAPLEPGSQRP